MGKEKKDNDLVLYIAFFLITVFLFFLTLQINDRGKTFVEDPKLLPFIVEGCMALISVVGIIGCLLKERPFSISQIKDSLFIGLRENKTILLAIAIVGIYIASVFIIGFYISSFVLICSITIAYVRRIKFYWSILIAAGLTILLYLVFAVGFKIQLY